MKGKKRQKRTENKKNFQKQLPLPQGSDPVAPFNKKNRDSRKLRNVKQLRQSKACFYDGVPMEKIVEGLQNNMI